MDDIVIRAAREADMPQIERIIRHYILTTVRALVTKWGKCRDS
jgi:hypothetical protein